MSSAGLPKAWRGLNAGSYTPPPLLVCLQPRLLKPSSAYARFYQAGPLRQPRRPPSALSPFAQLGYYLRWGDVVRLLGGRYPSFVAHIGSCATPVELSLPSAFSLVPRVLAGCTQSLLLTGAFRVGRDVTTPTHRSGRANFQHPVPDTRGPCASTGTGWGCGDGSCVCVHDQRAPAWRRSEGSASCTKNEDGSSELTGHRKS